MTIRHFAITSAMVGALTLGACTPTGTGPGGTTVDSVQAAAVLACKFLPTVKTITDIFAANIPGLTTATTIAAAICAAVLPDQATTNKGEAVTTPKVGNVDIHGQFVH